MRSSILAFMLLLGSISAKAQWLEYSAKWEDRPGKMQAFMDVDRVTYKDRLHFIVELSYEVAPCDDQGYPDGEDYLAAQDEVINSDVEKLLRTKAGLSVGRFYYQCKAKEYIYMSDTAQVTKDFEGVKIIYDPEWKVYHSFIKPDEYLEQTAINAPVIELLEQEGYDLSSKSTLIHSSRFASEADRRVFETFIKELNFRVVSTEDDRKEALPYRLIYSRDDTLINDQLSNITLRLHQRTVSLGGAYQGWEIEVD